MPDLCKPLRHPLTDLRKKKKEGWEGNKEKNETNPSPKHIFSLYASVLNK